MTNTRVGHTCEKCNPCKSFQCDCPVGEENCKCQYCGKTEEEHNG